MVRFNGASRGRITMAALACFKAGERSRLIYRLHFRAVTAVTTGASPGRTTESCSCRRTFSLMDPSWSSGTIWMSIGASICREYAAEHDWLTVVQLPTNAPDFTQIEVIWSLLWRAVTANVVFTDRGHLVRTVRSGMHRIQCSPCLIDGCLVGTGLSIAPAPTATTQRKGQ
ncbi:IS630 family transposase [Streptomyces sp. NPDC127077]|uniref:IS630 family transposase n=1 Tax=Streptomyces sp. NPDC127077 TaxID=3347131 RepID=UPI00364D787C